MDRVKKNLNQDFADGSLIGIVLKHYLPETEKLTVDLRRVPESTL